ncbi:hypothetical protein H6F87_26340 [Cyanobacteria bacterium FACHB-502]|uniref:hypothetical protein n=1 Tax=Leptolyngbya sp. GB1-A1 TaxID=2933908 RepID=UPI001998FDDE|nr:hypothetical protein [Cyanobacteria bacterium FACHB-502]
MTQYVCPICGQPLEEASYSKDGTLKTKLICSDPIARLNEDHKPVVYYSSSNGGFWSFGLKARPIVLGEQSSLPVVAPPEHKPTKRRRRGGRASNRQRQLSL